MYALTIKTLSIHLLHIIVAANKLSILCGDVGNAFVNAFTNEKTWTRAGPEFGPSLQGKPFIIVKALYGLASSAEHRRAHFAETLHSLGFTSSRVDPDIWLRMREDQSGYDYLCTHVNDFTIVAKEPFKWMGEIQSGYLVKDIGPPTYYLGNDYFTDSPGNKYVGSSTYVCEAIRKVESKYGELTPEHTSAAPDDHPEDNLSPLYLVDETKIFQGLLGTAQWIVVLG
jgi:hypothetical protein